MIDHALDLEPYERRLERLEAAFAEFPSLAIAFSGGVDSGVLIHAARRAMGERAIAVIADSASLPRSELNQARALAAQVGIELVELSTDELSDPRYRENAPDRCYFCKHALFEAMQRLCRARGVTHVAFGEIADDLMLLRHGSRAAREFGVVAPLSAAGFSKQDVRRYAADHGLSCAQKPASACLSSRLPTGTPVSRERLARIESAEESLRGLGLSVLRVRDHFPKARVEVGDEEFALAQGLEPQWTALLLALGFEAVELARYRPPQPAS